MNLSTNEIRNKFLSFFANRQHAILDSASLITTDEKTVTNPTLFNTAGVQPLIPYLLGKEHPQGKRLASSQKCLRTIDINEVGDKTHLTFFEMLGNWSLGDYFKEESIKWSYEFLTSKDEGLGLEPEKIYITVFAGNNLSERDEQSFSIWKKYVPESRIYYLESNWWEAGENGPCGPDTEIFYDISEDGLGELTHDEFIGADSNQKVVEIWNNVFMQFVKQDGKVVGKLKSFAVDTGAGLERLATVTNGVDSVYETDNFQNIIKFIRNNSSKHNAQSCRIISDHLKAAIFIIADGIEPSNTGRGYILRRLIRRAIRHANLIGLSDETFSGILKIFIQQYQHVYELKFEEILNIIEVEVSKFNKTLVTGLKELEKIFKNGQNISEKEAFRIFSTYGFPVELISEISAEKGVKINMSDFELEMSEHQEKSRTAAAGMFRGGLSSTGQKEVRLHTVTHLLNQALKDVLGNHVKQKGSNINSERLRFDFSHNAKMTDDEKLSVENLVNEKIKEDLPINSVDLPIQQALDSGAEHVFAEKYDETVRVYYIGESFDLAYSKEFCGGPHVLRTSEIGKFKILKEEASAAGVRRIKAVVE